MVLGSRSRTAPLDRVHHRHHVLPAVPQRHRLPEQRVTHVEQRRSHPRLPRRLSDQPVVLQYVHGYAGGCPVAAATVDCADSAREAAVGAFATWTGAVADALIGMGVPAARSTPLATLMISTIEGALLIARAEQSTHALDTAVRELGPLLDAAVSRPA